LNRCTISRSGFSACTPIVATGVSQYERRSSIAATVGDSIAKKAMNVWSRAPPSCGSGTRRESFAYAL
jgi:hypothetical protein